MIAKRYSQRVVIALFLLNLISAHAFAGGIGKFFQKPIDWAYKQSGMKDSKEKGDAALGNTAEAAKEAEKAIAELKPKATIALDSFTRTSDAAGTLLIWIKWPLAVSSYCLAVWLAGLAARSWKDAFAARFNRVSSAAISENTMTVGRRIRLISFGSMAFFGILFATVLDGTPDFRSPDAMLNYSILSAVVSLSIGITLGMVLFWFPVRRAWVYFGLGFISPIIAASIFTQLNIQ